MDKKYSLTDQIRRSSRSVSANIAESSRKIRYQKHFISKLTVSDSENAETQSWQEYALACEYISQETFNELTNKSQKVGQLINYYD